MLKKLFLITILLSGASALFAMQSAGSSSRAGLASDDAAPAASAQLVCSICLGPITTEFPVNDEQELFHCNQLFTPCHESHVCCVRCAAGWVQTRGAGVTCPICRAPLRVPRPEGLPALIQAALPPAQAPAPIEHALGARRNELIAAIEAENLPRVHELIEQGVPYHWRLEELLRALVTAHHWAIPELFIPQNHDVANSLLIDVVIHDDWESVQWLIAHGADVHIVNELPLGRAVHAQRWDIVRWLVEHEANVHYMAEMALRAAVEARNWDMVQWLVEHGAALDNVKPWIVLGSQLDRPTIQDLIVHDATANNVMLLIALRDAQPDWPTVQHFITHGADIHFMNETPLRQALRNRNWDMVLWLVENGADVTGVDLGEAMHVAIMDDNLAMVQFFITHGASTVHAVHLARAYHHPEMVEPLLEHVSQLTRVRCFLDNHRGAVALTTVGAALVGGVVLAKKIVGWLKKK